MEKKELRKYIRELKRRYTPEEKREMSYPCGKTGAKRVFPAG